MHVRVGASGEVNTLRWDRWRLTDLEDRVVRLRPVAEVAADPEAWIAGEVYGGLEALACRGDLSAPLDLRVLGVTLESMAVRNIPEEAARFAVPVYDFEVEVTAPAEYAGATGIWRVVAARDLVR